MKYVEVLPLTRTGAADQCFTYEFDGDVAAGSIVSIPLKNRTVRGMVTRICTQPKFATRPIKKILSEDPVLSDAQLEIAHMIADFYFAPLGDVISTMLPFDFGKKRRVLPTIETRNSKLEIPHKLTYDQQKIFKSISSAPKSSKHLLFGVTGSGKTEIYLQLIAEALKEGKSSIVLVPEISLTPLALERYRARFGDIVAIWHSQLKETEKFNTWQKIKYGEKMVIIGARSAIFAPAKNLGYVFIDEEHETSYKQDQTPRYETWKVAEWIADLTGAKLILGSATPRLETYFKTQNSEPSRQARDMYNLCSLPKRIVQDSMPPVKIIDLREEFKKGNKSIFSDDLYEAVHEALAQKKQVMLLVNRRGASTFVVCRDCGHVEECPNCEIPLTFHLSGGKIGDLRCHHCGYSRQIPVTCPKCNSHAIRYFGLGTQRVEVEARKMFPKAKIVRMDRDTTRKRGSHGEIYTSFAKKEYDIIIGTQLIAKGWDLPDVSVVGVISADTMLNLPDFRSAERTFDLLTQVAGRTGRGYHPGKVIIQTYSPENYAIKAARDHDFEAFYARELKERKKYGYPPYSTLIKLTYASKTADLAKKEAEEMVRSLKLSFRPSNASGEILQDRSLDSTRDDIPKIQILGPSPAFLPKLAGKYRYQIVIKIPNDKSQKTNKSHIKKSKSQMLDIIKKNLKGGWTVDVNPENLL